MARVASDPVARLPKLEAAQKRIGRKKVVVNMAELAEIVGLTPRRLTDIVKADPDFPVITRGAEGVPYEFDAGKVVKYLIEQARAVQAALEARRAEMRRLAGLDDPQAGSKSPDPGSGQAGRGRKSLAVEPGSAAPISYEDVRALEKLLDIQTKLREEKERQGLLIRQADVRSFLWRWMSGLQAEVLAIENRIDRASKLEPPQRAAVKDELAEIVLSMRRRLEKFIGPRPENVSDSGRDPGRDGKARGRRVSRLDRGSRRRSA